MLVFPITNYLNGLDRLCVAFLTFDVFFVVSCILLVCIIGMAVCCCLPCIIAIMYAVAEQVRPFLLLS